MNIYDKILDQCCSTDELRPGLCKPATQKRHTYASDGLILVRVPWNLPTICYVPHIKAPDFESVLPTPDISVPIYLSDLRRALDMVPKVPAFADCPQCRGEGEIECECCGQSSACAYCGGSGEGEQTGMAPDHRYCISLLPEAYLSVTLLSRLYDICTDLGSDPFLICGGPLMPHLFDVGPVRICIAPNSAQWSGVIKLHKRVLSSIPPPTSTCSNP